MDFPCSECEYVSRCFFVLKTLIGSERCQQGRKKKKPQTKITDFPGKGDNT